MRGEAWVAFLGLDAGAGLGVGHDGSSLMAAGAGCQASGSSSKAAAFATARPDDAARSIAHGKPNRRPGEVVNRTAIHESR
ncbi:hypothetical protein GCM10011320_03520 [Neoroseomonas lacus]|uniref:Uncharacterized protein n=1 Tax=Neoroseomonas lacus TaxID=287609 RepID=A0A917K413_9PROT|nr:hypothetical protein GCM10011320_03520 [Neoroseomonas lacus]